MTREDIPARRYPPLTIEALLKLAAGSDDILAAYIFGSRGRHLGVDDKSDWDVWIVLRDDAALARFDEKHPYEHGARVEIATSTLDGLARHGAIGSASEWARYQHAHVDIRVDKTAGELERILATKESLSALERDVVVRRGLGAYINASYRSLRYCSRLDAAESVGHALEAIFALASRVRPFNKYLEWELREHPLEGWEPDALLTLVEGVLDHVGEAQHELFCRIEAAARARAYGDAIDEWEPDLEWLRGHAEYRAFAR